MSDNTTRTALVTGASSGLGLEAAAQLADEGFGRVVITARSDAKSRAAQAALRERTGKDVFATLTIDLDDHTTVEAAATLLAEDGRRIDVLLLNAGIAPTKDVTRTRQGIEATVAATLIGHHVLATRLLDAGLLADEARIIIAGSEAARGDVPMFSPIDIDELAAASYAGDREAAIEALMRMDDGITYHPGNTYATVKVFAAWWVAELARRVPDGMAVYAVSPGSTPDTNAVRNAPFLMKYVLLPVFKFVPGMSHTVADGARRYLDVAGYDAGETGKFFASAPKKMTGPLHEVDLPHLRNRAGQEALWTVTTRVAGGVDYAA